MTAPDVHAGHHVDVAEALSQLKQDLVAVDEAVWSGLTRRLPERRGVMRRLKGAGDARADLAARKPPVRIRPVGVPAAGASGSMWSVIGHHSAVVDLLPAGTSVTAVCFAGAAVAAAGLTFEPASPQDREAVQRLQETARAGVELSLELAQLEVALNDALASHARSTAVRPVLAQRADRVVDTLQGYLTALDETDGLGDLDVHFPWAVDAELDPSTVRIRQTLTIDAESLRASVLEFVDNPGSRASIRTDAPSAEPRSAVTRTADDLAQRIGALADTMDEVSQLAERHGADDLRDPFARAWADGMFAYDTFRTVANSGSGAAAGETFEATARRLAGLVETACSTLTGRSGKTITDDLRARVADATEVARQLILTAQYLDAIVQAPAVSTRSTALADLRGDDTTIGDVKAAADGMTSAFERARARVSVARYHTGFGLPGLSHLLHEGETAIERGRSHLANVLLQTGLIAVAPDLPVAQSRLERTTSEIDGVVSASLGYDQLIAQAAHEAQLISEAPGAYVDRGVVDELYWARVSPLASQAATLHKEWTGLTAALDRIGRS